MSIYFGLDDYQMRGRSIHSSLWNNHTKNVPCELLANGTIMTRAELMRHAHLHRQQTKTRDIGPGDFC
jgi:hypothetical protein